MKQLFQRLLLLATSMLTIDGKAQDASVTGFGNRWKQLYNWANTNNKFIRDAIIYGVKTVTAENSFDLINFKSEVGEPMTIGAIKFLEGINANLNRTVWESGIIDPILQNGSFQIVVNGSNVTPLIPLTVAVRTTNTGISYDPTGGIFTFTTPIDVPEQADIKVKIYKEAVATVANTNMRCELIAVKASS